MNLGLHPILGTTLALATLALGQSACSADDPAPAASGDAGALPSDGGSALPDASPDAAKNDAGGGDAASGDPCALGASATGNLLRTKQIFMAETPQGGTLSSGRYQLGDWGQKSVPIAYELEMQLVLQLGTPNLWNAAQAWGDATKHAGGGTFTVDAVTHKITFTKTCGEMTIDEQTAGSLTAGYTVSASELRLINAHVHGATGADAILVFAATK